MVQYPEGSLSEREIDIWNNAFEVGKSRGRYETYKEVSENVFIPEVSRKIYKEAAENIKNNFDDSGYGFKHNMTDDDGKL